jgi:hypothetical protein
VFDYFDCFVKTTTMKIFLVLLTAFVTLTAIAGGLLLIMDQDGTSLHLTTSMLQNTPFDDYLTPGILLLLLVGGSNGIALVNQLVKSSGIYRWTIAGAIILIIWTIIQMLIFSGASWLQVLFLFTGMFMVLLTWQLKGKWAA